MALEGMIWVRSILLGQADGAGGMVQTNLGNVQSKQDLEMDIILEKTWI